MYQTSEVPAPYRRLFFVNAGGPLRKVVSREKVDRHWQLVTLDCGDRVLLPGYRQSRKVACGFCGGLVPLASE